MGSQRSVDSLDKQKIKPVIDYILNYQWKWKEHVNRINTGKIPNKFYVISQEDKKLTVRKPKMWPRNSQIGWNRPMQWKRNKEMRLVTWNVHTLYRAGAMNEMVKEMERYKIDVCALQEIRWQGKGTVVKKNYMSLYSRHKSDKHKFVTGFYISRHNMDNLLDSEPINENSCKIRIKLK
jgi:hypothetical protein